MICWSVIFPWSESNIGAIKLNYESVLFPENSVAEAKLNIEINVLEPERQDCKSHSISNPTIASYVWKTIPHKPNSKKSSTE